MYFMFSQHYVYLYKQVLFIPIVVKFILMTVYLNVILWGMQLVVNIDETTCGRKVSFNKHVTV